MQVATHCVAFGKTGQICFESMLDAWEDVLHWVLRHYRLPKNVTRHAFDDISGSCGF